MKRISFLIYFLIISGTLMAAIPQALNFQGIAKRKNGTTINNSPIYLWVYVDDTTSNFKPYYLEQDSAVTDSFGTFTVLIGLGKRISPALFSQIPWASPARIYLGVLFDTLSPSNPNYNPIPLGPIQMVTVPYAFAASAVSGIMADTGSDGDIMRYDAKNRVWRDGGQYAAGNGITIIHDTISVTSVASGIPPGCIMPFAGDTAHIPAGWLLCDGRQLPTAKFPALFGAISTSWGGAGGNFNLPDMRGMFMRGASLGTGADPDAGARGALKTGGNTGDNVGSYQSDTIKMHGHGTQPSAYYSNETNSISTINGGSGSNGSINTTNGGSATNREKTLPFGGNETRPKNVYVNYIIKY